MLSINCISNLSRWCFFHPASKLTNTLLLKFFTYPLKRDHSKKDSTLPSIHLLKGELSSNFQGSGFCFCKGRKGSFPLCGGLQAFFSECVAKGSRFWVWAWGLSCELPIRRCSQVLRSFRSYGPFVWGGNTWVAFYVAGDACCWHCVLRDRPFSWQEQGFVTFWMCFGIFPWWGQHLWHVHWIPHVSFARQVQWILWWLGLRVLPCVISGASILCTCVSVSFTSVMARSLAAFCDGPPFGCRGSFANCIQKSDVGMCQSQCCSSFRWPSAGVWISWQGHYFPSLFLVVRLSRGHGCATRR